MTRLTDIVPIRVFSDVVESKLAEQSRFRQSGVIGTDPRVTAKAQTAGLEVTVREWRRPQGSEATSQSDNPADRLTANAVQQAPMVARMLSRSRAFSAMLIADYASDADAIDFATSEFARLRAADEEGAILAMLTGIAADNVANNACDMVRTRHITTGTIVAANLFNAAALIAGRTSMGDMGGDLTTLVMHSDVVNALRAAEPNAFIPASQTNLGLERYMGYNVIETDTIGRAGTGPHPIYTTYMCGDSLFAYAAAPVDVPLAQVRDEFAGNGSGQETVINRYRSLIHPAGFSNVVAPTNGVSQTNAQLAAAATWDRVLDRKAIPLVTVTTNG